MKIYVASKIKHAPKWKALRDLGLPFSSTWIDEAEPGMTKDLTELSCRCFTEIRECDAVLLYAEDGEQLVGALMEAGYALALEKPVFAVGPNSALMSVFSYSPWWHSCDRLVEAHQRFRDLVKSGAFSRSQS